MRIYNRFTDKNDQVHFEILTQLSDAIFLNKYLKIF